MQRRTFLKSGALAVSAAATPAALEAATSGKSGKQPNIVFIMADDLGYADLGCYGSRSIKTPAIDALARAGVKLTDGYSNSAVCSSTRVGLVTGRYQYRLPCGLAEPLISDDLGLPEDEDTLPKSLQKLGYRTVLVGKWHIGGGKKYNPLRAGYDHFFGITGGGGDYFAHTLRLGPIVAGGLVEGETQVERQGYLTDLIGDRAVQEVRDARAENKPLYMSVHFTAPHSPWEGPEDEELAKTVGNSFHTDGGNLETYGKMVESMDQNIAKIVEELKALGMIDNTIIIFTSDNGGERFSDVWPFTGAKTELLEGGIRVPIIASWPGHIPAGSETSQMMISMDFVPTLLRAAGVKKIEPGRFDGEDLLDVLTGKAEPHSRKLYWRYKAVDQAAIRDGDWKYLRMGEREFLFNLAEDAHERANKIRLEPERYAAMKADWQAWNDTMLPYKETTPSHGIADFLADRYAPDHEGGLKLPSF
ncbi:sulfatase family protein [Croceicoccus bisphenolivorans]|uniref:sulfatase family protein n=1 Tax=Croceicoccus bisphenolivorans TaxID=1783232 RepID=UPI0009ECF925|nr:sulfatase-like hydrolase/transferase [Croceicoccus bisphenolivorans]